MGSISSEEISDQQSEDRCGSYSPSADVSESESSSGFSGRRFTTGASSSLASSPLALVKSGRAAVEPTRSLLPMPEADAVFWDGKLEKQDVEFSEVEMMKERFAKLLLGEDMSGGGKGVCTALAISNAITNLSATVFGELWRLEPLAPQKKAVWWREMEWLLCVSDSIVELIPSLQEFPGGGTFEVMASRPRPDLFMNLPALRKLDGMLLGMLDGFRDTEFWYVDRGIMVADEGYPSLGRPSLRQEEKWWLPYPRVPPNGLSDETRKKLQQCRDCANQILKAAMAINNGVLAEMEIPEAFVESLPKCGKACLGDIIYRYITAEQFSSECLLDCLDLSSEHHTLDIANRVEAATHVWRLKNKKRNPRQSKGKKSWGGKVKELVTATERSELLSQRADGLLQSLRLRYPSLPQTVLDMNKIQYNKDVGQSILESYSRVMESLAFNIMARIDDLIFVDDSTKKCIAAEEVNMFNRGRLGGLPIQKKIAPSPFSVQSTPFASPFSTPFCSSTPVGGSPGRSQLRLSHIKEGPPEKDAAADSVWSYTGNLSALKDAGHAPERD